MQKSIITTPQLRSANVILAQLSLALKALRELRIAITATPESANAANQSEDIPKQLKISTAALIATTNQIFSKAIIRVFLAIERAVFGVAPPAVSIITAPLP